VEMRTMRATLYKDPTQSSEGLLSFPKSFAAAHTWTTTDSPKAAPRSAPHSHLCSFRRLPAS